MNIVTTNRHSAVTEAVRAEMELLDPDDLCDLLKVGKDWLYDQCQANRIPYIRLGRQLRFRPAEIQSWLRGEWQTPVVEEPGPVAPRRGRPRRN